MRIIPKKLISLLLIVLPSTFVLAAENSVLTVSVMQQTPRLSVDGRGFTHVQMDGAWNIGKPGSPSLPSETVNVLIPYGHKVVNVSIHGESWKVLPGRHQVYPVQRKYPYSYSGPKTFTPPDPVFYSKVSSLPQLSGQAMSLQHKRGFGIVPVLIHPVRYSPASGNLMFAPRMEISVETRPDDKFAGKAMASFRGMEDDFAQVAGLVHNPDQLKTYPRFHGSTKEEYKFVLVTSKDLAQCQGDYTWQTLLNEKNARGVSTLVKTMDDIHQEYKGVDDAERVRTFIRDMYENHGTEYVLLGGDADLEVVGGETEPVIVPVRGLWGDIGYGGEELNMPSDMYYACLDGTFDADLDGIYGEETDDVDLMSEVLVGRVPADSCAEVSNFVKKTLAYKSQLDASLKNVWLAGEWLGPDSYGGALLEPVATGSYQQGRFLSGFAENGFFEVKRLYDMGVCEKDCWDADDILSILNSGIHVIHHVGHSITNYNMRLTCDDIDAGLTNDQYFFDYTGGCYPGSFDNRLLDDVSEQDSFVEHLLLGQHGAFAAIMSTRYGVGNTLPLLFWDAAFGIGMKNMAAMHASSRERAAGLASDREIRWELYGMNFFGDPEAELQMSDSTHPLLGTRRSGLFFAGNEITVAPQNTILPVRNDGQGRMAWTASVDQSWVNLSSVSGQAPATIEVSVDAQDLDPGQYHAEIILSSPEAENSSISVPVDFYVARQESVQAIHSIIPPVVDGRIEEDEYDDSGFLDVGLVAPGLSTAYIANDGQKLYLALLLFDDSTEDAEDTMMLYLDSNGDKHWPEVESNEGAFYFDDNGNSLFIPMHDNGQGTQYGDFVPTQDVDVAFGTGMDARVVEVSIDLKGHNLDLSAGDTLGLGLLYWDGNTGQWPLIAVWPSILASTGAEYCGLLGDVSIGQEADRLVVQPDSVALAAIEKGEPGDPVILELSATTQGELDFTIGEHDPWIELSSAQGTTPASLEVRANPQGLASGDYQGSITILAPGAKNSPVTIPVSLSLAPLAPAIGVDQTALSFEMTEGGAVPGDKTISMENTGGGELNWTAQALGPWLSVSPDSGTGAGQVSVSITDESLAAGSYSSAVLFSAQGASAITVQVSLIVKAKEDKTDPVVAKDPGGCSACSSADSSGGMVLFAMVLLLGLLRFRSKRSVRINGD